MTYRSERIEELTNRAKRNDKHIADLDIGETAYLITLIDYIRQFRRNEIDANELRTNQMKLRAKLEVYYRHCEIYEQAADRRNRYSPVLTEAEKYGCPICKKIVRIFDGRDRGGG